MAEDTPVVEETKTITIPPPPDLPKSGHAGNLPPHWFTDQNGLTEDQKLAGYTLTGFYVYDETQAFVIGPFATPEIGLEGERRYARYLEYGTKDADYRTAEETAKFGEQLTYLFLEVFGSKAEFSGRFCLVCKDTTAHARARGRSPLYEKKGPWLCTPCLLPGGALHQIVISLNKRQGEKTAP